MFQDCVQTFSYDCIGTKITKGTKKSKKNNKFVFLRGLHGVFQISDFKYERSKIVGLLTGKHLCRITETLNYDLYFQSLNDIGSHKDRIQRMILYKEEAMLFLSTQEQQKLNKLGNEILV